MLVFVTSQGLQGVGNGIRRWQKLEGNDLCGKILSSSFYFSFQSLEFNTLKNVYEC